MGCVSSTEVVTDPVTGEVKKKKKLGGAYPGQMGQQHAPYQPPASAFQNGLATAHFVSYGGGNALTLMQPDGSTKPQHGGPETQFIKVTLPPGVVAGQKIHVQAPDGRLNEIIVPNGFGAGSSFTVEFAPASAAPPAVENKIPVQQAAEINNTRVPANDTPYATADAVPVDDGFASGFNNPNWTPSSNATEVNAYPVTQSSGPYATAKPY